MDLTSKEAYEVLGGRSAVNRFVAKTNKMFGQWADVSITPCIDEENPEDMDFLNLQIEMKYNSNSDLSSKFMEQKEDAVTDVVWKFLNKFGLDFEYECSGDGENGPISSYRIYAPDEKF